MPIVNRVADLQPDIQAWRRDIHQHPELLYDVHRTAAFVADRLREFGCDEVVDRHGQDGCRRRHQGQEKRQQQKNHIGLRADMDALNIYEQTNLPLCLEDAGQDARLRPRRPHRDAAGGRPHPAEPRDFDGTAIKVLFQPAEEGGAAARCMVKEGVLDAPNVDAVFGMHMAQETPVGKIAIRSGPSDGRRRSLCRHD